MIFRTGSVLIVGMCEENILYELYTFISELLQKEFCIICQQIIITDNNAIKKSKKIRKKTINITRKV